MFLKETSRLFAVLFFGFMILSGPASADETKADAIKDDIKIIQATPALWKITQGEGTVFLLGSFHILPKNYHWYEGIIAQNFEKADELVLEAEITPQAEQSIQALMIKNGFFADGDSLKNHLDPVHYKKLLDYSKKLMGLNEEMTIRSKPWFMSLQLSVMAMMSHGMDPNSGVDKFMAARARKSGKNLTGLETAEAGISALINHPMPVQSAMLADTLDKLDEFESYINSYLEAWASGDAARLTETMIKDMADQKELYQALLVDRNVKWLPIIENYIRGGRTIFIVVGAAHLVGPDSIIKMLAGKGYRIDKIQ